MAPSKTSRELAGARALGRAAATLAAAVAVALAGVGCTASKLGLQYYEQEDWERATPMLREAILAEPEKADELMPFYLRSTIKLANQLADQGRFDSAFEQIERARQERFSRDNAELRNAKVALLIRFARKSLDEGNIDLALDYAGEALRIQPTNRDALRLKGETRMIMAQGAINAGSLDAALRYIEEYLRDFPDDQGARQLAAETLLRRGVAMQSRNQTTEALRLYASALSYNPRLEQAIDRAILACETPSASLLVNNYKSFIDYVAAASPSGNPRVFARLLDQFQRRMEDALEQADPARARLFAFAKYDLDPNAQANLDEHERNIMRVVAFSEQRGEIDIAQTSLAEAARRVPPLAGKFNQLRDTIRQENEDFFALLNIDLGLLRQTRSRMTDAMRDTASSHSRREIQNAARLLAQQEDALALVSRQRNRALLNRAHFAESSADRATLDRIREIIGNEEFEHYRDLMRRYR